VIPLPVSRLLVAVLRDSLLGLLSLLSCATACCVVERFDLTIIEAALSFLSSVVLILMFLSILCIGAMFMLNNYRYKNTQFVNRCQTYYLISDVSLRGATLSLVCKYIRFYIVRTVNTERAILVCSTH